jgi:hypothetical protein
MEGLAGVLCCGCRAVLVGVVGLGGYMGGYGGFECNACFAEALGAFLSGMDLGNGVFVVS